MTTMFLFGNIFLSRTRLKVCSRTRLCTEKVEQFHCCLNTSRWKPFLVFERALSLPSHGQVRQDRIIAIFHYFWGHTTEGYYRYFPAIYLPSVGNGGWCGLLFTTSFHTSNRGGNGTEMYPSLPSLPSTIWWGETIPSTPSYPSYPGLAIVSIWIDFLHSTLNHWTIKLPIGTITTIRSYMYLPQPLLSPC